MIYDHLHNEATPRARSTCPHCDGDLIAKCGPIVTWHWAHLAADCDPWTEPESQWHIDWKRWFEIHRGAQVEVPMGNHRADVVLPNGTIIELQSGYLGVDDIYEREMFYGRRLAWVYRAHWMHRVHFGERGFWWKHGSKAMTYHDQPVWWHTPTEILQVRINLVDSIDEYGDHLYERVLGKITNRRPAPNLQERPAVLKPEPPEQLSLLPAS